VGVVVSELDFSLSLERCDTCGTYSKELAAIMKGRKICRVECDVESGDVCTGPRNRHLWSLALANTISFQACIVRIAGSSASWEMVANAVSRSVEPYSAFPQLLPMQQSAPTPNVTVRAYCEVLILRCMLATLCVRAASM
jgi:hypothetical protein